MKQCKLSTKVENIFSKAKLVNDIKIKQCDFDKDPVFVSDFHKSMIVNDILLAMENKCMSRSKLAKKIGTSQEYVDRMLAEEIDITISMPAKITCALDVNMILRIGHKENE